MTGQRRETMSNETWQQTLDRLGTDLATIAKCGISDEEMARLRARPDSCQAIADLIAKHWVAQLPKNELKLAKVLGLDGYFGSRVGWSSLYWQHLGQDELNVFPEFPWPLSVFNEPCPFNRGKKVRETHSVFLTRDAEHCGIGVVQDMIDLQRGARHGKLEVLMGSAHWLKLNQLDVCRDTGKLGWHLAVSLPVLHGNLYTTMMRLIPKAYCAMPICSASFHALTYYHRHGKWPFDDIPAGFRNTLGLTVTQATPNGTWKSQYCIGLRPDSQTAHIDNCGREACDPQIGIFVERIPPNK